MIPCPPEPLKRISYRSLSIIIGLVPDLLIFFDIVRLFNVNQDPNREFVLQSCGLHFLRLVNGNRFVLGRISEKPSNHFERMRALADYMAVQLAPDGITGVDVVMVDSLEEMREMLASGGVDFMSETAFMASELVDAGVAELMLREWKQGVAEYHSLFFVRADSGLKDIADLPGHSIAFEDPGSTSAYLVPRVTLNWPVSNCCPWPTPGVTFRRGWLAMSSPRAKPMWWLGCIGGWPMPVSSAISTGQTIARHRSF